MSDETQERAAPAMPRRLRLVGRAAGTAATLLGLTTSCGWLFDLPYLVQFHPSLAPMVLNTALCFLLAGLGLLAVTRGRTIGSRCCGVVTAALATSTLTAYLVNPGLRIDQLVASGLRFTDPSDPGRPLRMAPNTATAFLLVGLSLALAGQGARASGAAAAAGAAGIAVLSLSLVALVGYVFGIEPAFGWGRMVAMSPQTAAGLAIVGSAIVLLLGRPDLTVGHHRKRWLALLAGSASATTTLLLWQGIVADQGHTLQQRQQSALPFGVLGGGLVFSGLLAWSVLKTGEARLASATLEREVAERRVAEEERDKFFSLSLDMLCISSADGYFKRLNPAFEETLGYSVDELTGRPFLGFVHPDDIAATLAEVDRQMGEGIPTLHFENRYRRKDGTYRWLAWRSMPDVKTGMMYALARDVTEEKRTAGRLQASEERYRGLVEKATDIIFRTDLAGTFTFVNAVAVRVMGYSEEELLGKHFSALVRPDQRQEVRHWYETGWSGNDAVAQREFLAIAKDGHELWIEQTVQPVMQAGRIVAFQAIARDVTARKTLEADRERLIGELKSTLAEVQTLSVQMETLSLTDALTGVPNRRAFEQALEKEIARARRHDHALGLLALDIDHFKHVNDAYGHEGGDEVLRSFVRTVVAVLRTGDSLYRTGGEEFAVILPYAAALPLVKAAQRIVTAVAGAAVNVGERLVPLTTSAGAACLQPGGDGREVWARADAALYEAKKAGRNRVCLSQAVMAEPSPA